ncbi:MAG: general secretion pathway protein GspB [Halioglobus sp.]
MSLILDALNRSRQDTSPVPGLGTLHQAEPLPAERRPYLLWAALVLAVLVIAWLVFDRLHAPPTEAEEIGAPVAQLSRNIDSAVSSVTTELKARVAAAEQAQQATPDLQPVVVEREQSTTAQFSASAEPVPTPTAPAPAPAQAAQDDAVARLYQNRNVPEEASEPRKVSRPQQTNTAPEENPLELDKILRLAQEEMKNASLDEHPVPFLADLSQQTKDAIPTIYYLKHDYSSDPSVSSVVLNGTSARVGGSPVPGLKVEEILPDSVVLSYQGTQFRLRALNSWVNL